MKVLHVALEFTVKVGGLGSVTTGLIPALNRKGVETSIVTPYYDAYDRCYSQIQPVGSVKHIYKGKVHTSNVYCATMEVFGAAPVKHYLIRPLAQAFNNKVFAIDNPTQIYLNFPHSQSQNRREYFNGAVAALVRTRNANIPSFDIVHLHTWHATLSGVLIKEFSALHNYKQLLTDHTIDLRPAPHVFFTTHMLREADHGYIRTPEAIKDLCSSVGLPADFPNKFPQHKTFVSPEFFNLHALGLLYADHASIVSKSVVQEIFNGAAHGMLDVFAKLRAEDRFEGITNGICSVDWDPTLPSNLPEHTLKITDCVNSKQQCKNYLSSKYAVLNPTKPWFLFVGRFADEKGIDLLPAALSAIKAVAGNLIIMGIHIAKDRNYSASKIVDDLRLDPDVLVIDDAAEQKKIGKLVRASSQFTLVPSNNETCGIVPMEAQACGSIPIVSNIQGLPDTVKPLTVDFTSGTGFLFNYAAEATQTQQNFRNVILTAHQLYTQWQASHRLESLLQRLIIGAKQYDWDAYAAPAYVQAYRKTLSKPLMLTSNTEASNIAAASASSVALLTQFKHSQPKTNVVAAKPRIFQIGFNKCGSHSLHGFFEDNGITSIHYDGGHLASYMYSHNLDLPTHFKDHTAFFDLENIYHGACPAYIQFLFKELDQKYPGSKFILNTRSRENWIKSRCKHDDEVNTRAYIDVLCERYKLTKEQLIARWRQEWDTHHAAVQAYFKDRPGDLLVFNIETDGGDKLCQFFKQNMNLDLDPKHYQHLYSSAARGLLKINAS